MNAFSFFHLDEDVAKRVKMGVDNEPYKWHTRSPSFSLLPPEVGILTLFFKGQDSRQGACKGCLCA